MPSSYLNGTSIPLYFEQLKRVYNNIVQAGLYCITGFFFLFFFQAKGQHSYFLSDSYVSVSTGIAAPVGDLSSTTSSDWSGYAKTGFTVNIATGIDLYNGYGIAAMAGYSRNSYKISDFINNVSYSNPGTYSLLQARPYIQEYFMLGPYFTRQLEDNSWIDIRVMAGIMVTSYPNPNWVLTDGTGNSQWSVSILQSSGFVLDIGGGYKYSFGSRLFFLGYLDFLYGYSRYSGTLNVTGSLQGSQFLSGNLSMPYLNLTVGLGYQIFK